MVYKKPKWKRRLGIVSWILLYALIIYGLFYTLLPHSIHQRFSPDWLLLESGFSHTIHVTIGIVLLVVGALFVFFKFRGARK